MRPGRRLAIDFGDVRIGVAACDPGATLAFPVTTVPAGKGDLDAIAALVAEYEPIEVVVGLPRTLAGTEGIAAQKIRARAVALAARLSPDHGSGAAPSSSAGSKAVPVRLVDERLSTVQAVRGMQSAGKRSRDTRAVIDQAAAREILEHALEAERHQGTPPGDVVSPSDGGRTV